ARAVLRVPGEALAHGAAGHEIGKAFQHMALARIPRPFDELHDADAHAMTETAHDHAESRRRFALAGAGMDDDKAALLGLGREHFGARRLALRHLLGVAAVELFLALDILTHRRFAPMSANSSRTLLRRGVHNPRSIASPSRAPISRSASGLCSSRKPRTSLSPR